ncbi:MAG: DUF2029 domain-containing protein, partial [Lachnospiraceae bacterium]|nr:DUF2029 domain-containing protein [Lachnospiraceae bacterium]
MKQRDLKTTNRLLFVFVAVFSVFFFTWLFLFVKDTGGSQRGVLFNNTHDLFMDWFNVVYHSIGRRPYIWGRIEERCLPPLTYVLLYPFSKLYSYDVSQWVENDTRYDARNAQLPMIAATMVFLISYLLLFYSLYKHGRVLSDLKKAALFVVFFVSGVNLFCIDRGNLQVITAAALFIYIYACDRDGSLGGLKTGIGLLCLAFAASLKLFPAMMGVLLLYRKKWKEAAAALLLGMAMFFLPFLWMDQPFASAVSSFFHALSAHALSYRIIAELGFSTPVIMGLTGLPFSLLQVISYAAAVISLFCARSLGSAWKRIMLLSLTLVLTSGQQGYYCLMFLFLPIVLFFCEEHSALDVIYVLIFAIILSPLQRTAHVGSVDISAKHAVNLVLLVLYIWL